ncbi:MAG: multicomponent Na+:H+ antiporter subunit G [Candidatus Marinamargulisbacteria bacterium]|jgi:multicomponent Na+:H+ antiporter subunit G
MILNYLAVLFLAFGIFFFIGTAVGILRFPDFYTRMHAAGKGDTLSTVLMLAGCATYALGRGHFSLTAWLVVAKLLFIINFIFIGSPTATHTIMDAGYETGVKHWEKGEPHL